MECKDCGGMVNMERGTLILVSCVSRKAAFPCEACGRLHWADGEGVFNRGGNKSFLENGKLVIRHAETNKMLVVF